MEKMRSKNKAVKLKAIRDIKNQVIGNKRRKSVFIKLNAVQSLVEQLAEQGTGTNCRQSAILLSSLLSAAASSRFHDSSAAQALDEALPKLLEMLSSQDELVMAAALRTLCNVCEVSLVRCFRPQYFVIQAHRRADPDTTIQR